MYILCIPFEILALHAFMHAHALTSLSTHLSFRKQSIYYVYTSIAINCLLPTLCCFGDAAVGPATICRECQKND